MFVGEHGSWDRNPLNGYQVIFVPFVNGRPSGMPIPVVTDFLAADHKTVRGRPVGVALDRTGALIVADDVGNVVWRVSSAAARPPGQCWLGENRIRTCDPLLPKQMRYQAAPLPDDLHLPGQSMLAVHRTVASKPVGPAGFRTYNLAVMSGRLYR